MPTFFTRKGDDGKTGLLGEGRVSKAHLRIETLGSIDEASSALGFGRASSKDPRINELVLFIQHDLYNLMAEIAATPENNQQFQFLKADRVTWLESQIEAFSKITYVPKGFILPGDTLSGAAFSLARTTVRRAERRLAELMDLGFVDNNVLLKYLNRLSSFCFIIELFEIQSTGNSSTLAKGKTK
jgi:cob(I)alamin adenosyltransferase